MKPAARFRLDIPLALTMLLSAFLNGYDIWKDKVANAYYTTAVASMLRSFHNFFFGSLDPGGFVTVDKPPVTFWIQTISASIFGLHGWSVILPQALAGIGSVLLIYWLVKPSFGLAAARIAALALACTPIAASVSRTNNIDSMLVFTLLLGTCLLFRGLKKNRIWNVIGAFAVVGAGFNMKMLQAYMVLPAFYLFYWIAANTGWKKKIAVLSGATAVLLLVSLSWAVTVDSIPQDQRPYIGSSKTNSVLELAFGYNGISRLTGDRNPGESGGMPNWNGGGAPSMEDAGRGNSGQVGGADRERSGNRQWTGDSAGQGQAEGNNPANNGSLEQAPGGGMNGGPAGAGGPMGPGGPDEGGFGRNGGMFGTGTKGPLRLFQSALSGQASWLIPFAAIACVGLFAGLRRRNVTEKHKEALFWLAWLIPGMVFFSMAGFFHPYYLIMLAPPIAALVGAGWAELWELYRGRTGWLSWLLPAGIAATAAFEWYILHPYDKTIGKGWSTGVAAAGLLFAFLLAGFKRRDRTFAYAGAVIGLLVLFVGPLYWAATPITYGQSSMLPQAGPLMAGGRGMSGMGSGPAGIGGTAGMNGMSGMGPMGPGNESQAVDPKTLSFLKEHNTGETYLFAATDYNAASPYIISGETVITMGGFSGSDPAVTVEKLESLVKSGEVKYVMISGGGMGGGRGGNSDLAGWVRAHGTEVPSDQWKSEQNNGIDSRSADSNVFRQDGRGRNMALYQLSL